jgi:nucleoside-diphosphate-sugar epimerase
MKILILGGTGFLGQNAINYFTAKGHDVWAPRHEVLDLTNREHVEMLFTKYAKDSDIVLQLAASTTNSKDVVERPWIHVTDNAIMNSLIFKAAHEAGIKHVIFPSCTTMYPGNTNFPVMEDQFNREKIFPKYFGVASTKVYIEDMCKFWAGLGKTKFTAIRHSNIYGQYDRSDAATAHVCGATIRKVVESSPTNPIVVWGEGSEIRDLLHVDDLMAAFDAIIQKQTTPYELVNIGYGKGISVFELTKLIQKLAGKETSTILFKTSAPTLEFDLVLDSGKARRLFGWKPTIKLNDGLKQAIQWYKDNHAISNPS